MNSNIYNVLSQRFHILSCYDQHGIMLFYDINGSLTQIKIITNSCIEFDAFPSSLINSNVSMEWKQRKSKELGHAPWLVTLRG
jgi:hypothetical protein